MPGIPLSLPERRAAAATRRRAALRRRRMWSGAVALLLVAGGVAACTTIAQTGNNGGTNTGSSGPGPGGSNPPTTTTPPPSSYNVGLTTFAWTDRTRTTLSPAGASLPGRKLPTEVRYPTLSGSPRSETNAAPPALKYGPFPVIVFAHGFDVTPSTYEPLLDAWVHAGFVVVSPIFPDENPTAVAAAGGLNSPGGNEIENDVTNEPGDIAFVLKQFAAADAKGSGKAIAGAADMADVGLAGQSDGANAVSGLSFDSYYSPEWAALPTTPKAVEILSGQALITASGEYSSSASSPSVLQVQSDADRCNGAQMAADLYSHIDKSPVHLFETLHGASHLAPYTEATEWTPIVEKVTTEFFELELGWRTKDLSIEKVIAAGSTGSASSVSASITGFPNAPTPDDCSMAASLGITPVS